MLRRTATTLIIAVVGIVGAARADNGGVEFTPLGPGGVQWTVSVPAFETPLNYGSRVADGYSVPGASTVRADCFVLSPWLPVGHGDGYGEFIPDFYSTWQGVLYPKTGKNVPIFNLRVEIQRMKGVRIETISKYRTVTSAVFKLEPIYFPTDDSIFYWGERDNSLADIRVLSSFDVAEDDQIRVSACDLNPMASLKVRHLVVRTVPYEQ